MIPYTAWTPEAMSKNSFPHSAVNSDVDRLQLPQDIGIVLRHSWDALMGDGGKANERQWVNVQTINRTTY
jgi:hypothetical protein